jgi:hypothetical protein
MRHRILAFLIITGLMAVYTVFALTVKFPLRLFTWADELVERAIDWLSK